MKLLIEILKSVFLVNLFQRFTYGWNYNLHAVDIASLESILRNNKYEPSINQRVIEVRFYKMYQFSNCARGFINGIARLESDGFIYREGSNIWGKGEKCHSWWWALTPKADIILNSTDFVRSYNEAKGLPYRIPEWKKPWKIKNARKERMDPKIKEFLEKRY